MTSWQKPEVKYNIGMNKFVNKPAHNALEFAEWQTVIDATRLSLFTSFSAFARKHFTHPKLLQIMEFPVLFLGAKPEDTPALYSLMNYADTCLGNLVPHGRNERNRPSHGEGGRTSRRGVSNVL